MGHITDTYHDIAGLGIEYLRNIYASSGLSIRPKTKLYKIETVKALAIAFGLDPDVILSKEAMQKPHRTIIDGTYQSNDPTMILSKAIKNSIIDEINSVETRTGKMVARARFELPSGAPEAPILDR